MDYKSYKILDYLFLVVILLVSCGWIVVSRTGNDVILFIVGVYLVGYFFVSRESVLQISRSYSVLFFAVVFASFFQDFVFDEKEIAVIVKMIIAVLCCIYFKARRIDVLRIYVELMYWVCIFSLVFIFIIYVAPFLLVSVDSDYLTLFGLSFVRDSDLARFGMYRNQAFFWEAGVFGVMTGLAYFLNELIYRGAKARYVFLIAIFSTRSMGGLLIFVPAALYLYAYKKSKFFGYGGLLLGWGGVVVFALFPSLIDGLTTAIFERSINDDASIIVRVNDLLLGLKAAQDGLFLGRPSGDFDIYNDLLLELHGYIKGEDSGITNSIVNLVYKFGAPVAILYSVALGSFSKVVSDDHWLFFFLVMIGFLMIEPLALSVFWLLLLNWRLPKLAQNRKVG